MHLYLAETIHRLKVEPAYFFRLAHQWRFGRDALSNHDVLSYQVGGIIPEYVREYVQHLQQTERSQHHGAQA